jgi:hypothetical protein
LGAFEECRPGRVVENIDVECINIPGSSMWPPLHGFDNEPLRCKKDGIVLLASFFILVHVIDSRYRIGCAPCYPSSFMLSPSSYSYPHPVSMYTLTTMQVSLQLFCLNPAMFQEPHCLVFVTTHDAHPDVLNGLVS